MSKEVRSLGGFEQSPNKRDEAARTESQQMEGRIQLKR